MSYQQLIVDDDPHKIDVISVDPNSGSYELAIIIDCEIPKILTENDKKRLLRKINGYINLCDSPGLKELYPHIKIGSGTIAIISRSKITEDFQNFISPLERILAVRGIGFELSERNDLA
jgi:hypothetical protein